MLYHIAYIIACYIIVYKHKVKHSMLWYAITSSKSSSTLFPDFRAAALRAERAFCVAACELLCVICVHNVYTSLSLYIYIYREREICVYDCYGVLYHIISCYSILHVLYGNQLDHSARPWPPARGRRGRPRPPR